MDNKNGISKFKARNSKQIQMTKKRNPKLEMDAVLEI